VELSKYYVQEFYKKNMQEYKNRIT
jgi:hypothetical protein